MLNKLPTLKLLLQQLQHVPFLASKNLYKVASYFLQMPDKKAEQFCKVLLAAKQGVVACEVCFAWKELDDPCIICSDSKRDSSIICVVESWHNMLAIERTEGFHGRYHILNGLLCPLDGIGPEKLTVSSLASRITLDVKEVVIALNQTPEGEVTTSYIAQQLASTGVRITSLAKGVPVGASLEYVDRLTISRALSERRNIS